MKLIAENISKTIRGKKILSEISLELEGGKIYGFTGPNGSGKTMLFRALSGLMSVDSGIIRWNGGVLRRDFSVLPSLGIILENVSLYSNLTGFQNLKYLADIKGKIHNKEIREALKRVGLDPDDRRTYRKYSLGMKQRLGIANAILHDPELLILDEPTNGLDPIGIAEVRNFIKNLSVERGKTILISSHILSEISLLADDIGIIDHGVLLEESSMEELEKKNRKYIQLQVSDIPKASLILERQFHVTDYAVQDEHNLRLYDTALDMAAINKALVVQDVAVISSQICNDTLEDYFKQITGGAGIA